MRSEYQPLRSTDDEADIGDDRQESTNLPSASQHRRRALRPGSIDLTKLDHAFKRSGFVNF